MEKVPGLHLAIAKAVRNIRKSKRLTQGQLAGFAGLSEVYLSKLEQGLRGDSVNALVLIAQALGLSAAELMLAIEQELRFSEPSLPRKRGRPPKSDS